MFTRHKNKGKYFRGRGRRKHKFSQRRNHENFKEERNDRENSHENYKRDNFKKSSYDISKLQCYKCKKIGHIAPKCPQRTKPNEQSNLVEEDLEPTLLMAILEDEEQKVSLHEKDVGYKETNLDSLWYLDNEASNHPWGRALVRSWLNQPDQPVRTHPIWNVFSRSPLVFESKRFSFVLIMISRSSMFLNIEIVFPTFSQTFENRVELLAIPIQCMPLACQRVLVAFLEIILNELAK
ncbi:zinc finger, CCHC-type containing protein, partial [Tanacetum coccineum]